jgi:hypothetical protein
MPLTPQGENSSGAALWRVGRNLLCFQQIEATLKSLLPVAQVSGTIAQIEAQIRERQRKAKKASFGTLAESYEQQMLNGPRAEQEPEVGEEILMSFSFSSSIDASPETLKDMKSQWRRLVTERNQLVHSTLIAYDLDSTEGCRALSEHLDAQYERARQLLDRLVHHQTSRAFAASAFLQLSESGQLDNLITLPPNDA